MFKRFKHIGDYRIYSGWSDGAGAQTFERVNLIFGTNGSGKSTLAQLLQDSVDGALPASADIRFTWQESETSNDEIITDDAHDAWKRVHVFNKDYVTRSLRFESVDGPQPDALLTLGEENVLAEEELVLKRARSEELAIERAKLRNQISTSKQTADDLMRSAAQNVVSHLGNGTNQYRASNVYNISQVRAFLQSQQASLALASTDITADLDIVRSLPMAATVHVNQPRLSNADDFGLARSLLEETIAANAIESLHDDGRRSDWVQAGVALHSNLDDCLFCGGPLTSERRSELDAHFDSAVENLQGRIDDLIRRLNDSSLSAEKYLDALPRTQDLYTEAVVQFEQARTTYVGQLVTYQTEISGLVSLLREKRSNPFKTFQIERDYDLTPPNTIDIEESLTIHDTRSASHTSSVSKAARRLELRYIADVAGKVADQVALADTSASQLTALDSEQLETDRRIAALTNLEADPTPLADELTQSLARLLGRDELSFTTGPDPRTYRIERGGEPATALSEGERTCIALLHFLARLRSSPIVSSKPIVIVDDPVSSLDHNVMFGISSHLWSEIAAKMTVSQIFVLTHSFEMFRQWLIQIDGAKRRVGKSTVQELRVRNRLVAGAPTRVPVFEQWPLKDAKRLRSQYHYLFAQVGKAVDVSVADSSLMEQLDVLALAPNTARRMLEAFLSFKFPKHVGNFEASMREALDAIEDGPVRTRIVRYVHAYSHNEDADIGRPLEPGEATPVLQSIFELMHSLDPNHYASMCETLELSPEVLRGA